MYNKDTFLSWVYYNRGLSVDLLRIYIGIGLLAKGVFFFLNPVQAQALLTQGRLEFIPYLLIHLVILIHVVGGLFLAIGFLTRIAALLQIPIVLGALFYIHLQAGFFAPEQTLEFVMLVLVLLVFFVVYGPGRLSIDNYLKIR